MSGTRPLESLSPDFFHFSDKKAKVYIRVKYKNYAPQVLNIIIEV